MLDRQGMLRDETAHHCVGYYNEIHHRESTRAFQHVDVIWDPMLSNQKQKPELLRFPRLKLSFLGFHLTLLKPSQHRAS